MEAPGDWAGDEWSTNASVGGASIFKHGAYWWVCGSYGAVAESSTIRCCHSRVDSGAHTGARGPYTDKAGNECLGYNAAKGSSGSYGATMLLGPEGDQLSPGAPYLWSEGSGEEASTYLGYSFRESSVAGGSEMMGVRRLNWVEESAGEGAWPTVWTPLTISFAADDYPSAIGKPLTIALSNAGAAGSKAGFDLIELKVDPTPIATAKEAALATGYDQAAADAAGAAAGEVSKEGGTATEAAAAGAAAAAKVAALDTGYGQVAATAAQASADAVITDGGRGCRGWRWSCGRDRGCGCGLHAVCCGRG